MGCTQSRIENEETVHRCKERKLYMDRAVMARNKFSSAHSATAVSLKNTGAALSDFAQGEVVVATPAGVAANAVPSYENFIRPPPPLPPSFSKTASPVHHNATGVEFEIPQSEHHHVEPIIEEDEEENEEDDDYVDDDDMESDPDHGLQQHSSSRIKNEHKAPPPMPENKGVSWDYFFDVDHVPKPMLSVPEKNRRVEVLDEKSKTREVDGESEKAVPEVVNERPSRQLPDVAIVTPKVVKRVKMVVPVEPKRKSGVSNLNLVQIFIELDDCFLKASESAHEVSRLLEATRLHYHSNFADKRGYINHSEKVMRAITWNKSFIGLHGVDDGMDDFDSEEHETHATVLDKMLAWEKKLFEEVKAGEQMKLTYRKKVAKLNKMKRRGLNMEALERMKAAVSHLHTRYIVDMQTMENTVSEINRLRDEQLYPKLVALVNEMAAMWETMRLHHQSQCKIVQALRLLDINQSSKETTDDHHEQTRQLCGVVQEWHTNFSELMTQKKDYIKALTSWLKLNLVPMDTHSKEKVSSPNRRKFPPIQTLLHTWHDQLEKLPDEPAKVSISNFAELINTIWQYQKEELEYRKRCDDSRKDLVRKTRDFEHWYNKYTQQIKKTPQGETGQDRVLDKDLIAEHQLPVEAAKQKLEEDEEEYQAQCVHVREKSLMSLKSGLPELFRAISDFSLACSDMYSNLRSIAHSQNRKDVR